MKDLRVVIPANNEESSIGEVIDRVKKSCADAQVLVVDDGSKDKTATIAREKGVIVISNPINMGHGAALKKGFLHITDSKFPIAYHAFLDADGTYPPERIPELYKLCRDQEYDVVTGSRLLLKNPGMPRIRRFGNRIFAGLLSLYSGTRISDISTGLSVFNARLVPIIESLPNGLDFTTALTAFVLFEGLRHEEVPIEYYKRTGKSKLSNIKDGYRILRVIMNACKKYKPLLFYLTLGIPFLVIDSLANVISAPSNHHG